MTAPEIQRSLSKQGQEFAHQTIVYGLEKLVDAGKAKRRKTKGRVRYRAIPEGAGGREICEVLKGPTRDNSLAACAEGLASRVCSRPGVPSLRRGLHRPRLDIVQLFDLGLASLEAAFEDPDRTHHGKGSVWNRE